MNVVRYEPWGMLRKFQQDVNRMLEQEGYTGNGELDASARSRQRFQAGTMPRFPGLRW